MSKIIYLIIFLLISSLVYAQSGIKIYRNQDNGTFNVIKTVPLGTETYTDRVTTPGNYCYKVSQFNTFGESIPTDSQCLQVNKPPLTVITKVTKCQFNLSGVAPDSTTGWSATFYRNNVIKLGTVSKAPYDLTVELGSGLNYDFWITWTKAQNPTINSEHKVLTCP